MGTAKGHLSSRIILGRLAISAALLTVLAFLGCQHSDPTVSDSATNERVLTFNKDVAPIIFKQCGTCHHPDGSGPFSLLTYEDVRKRARQIGEVTRSRYMPPWLPAHGYGEFIGERRLSDDEIETIGSWVSSGAVEGAPADLPPVPQWPGGWQLGEPDLILKIPEPYTLATE